MRKQRKDLKNRTPLGSAVDNNLYKELKKYSQKTKIPMSKCLDEAIHIFLKEKNINNPH